MMIKVSERHWWLCSAIQRSATRIHGYGNALPWGIERTDITGTTKVCSPKDLFPLLATGTPIAIHATVRAARPFASVHSLLWRCSWACEHRHERSDGCRIVGEGQGPRVPSSIGVMADGGVLSDGRRVPLR